MAKRGTKTRRSPTRKQPIRMSKLIQTMEKSRIAKTKRAKRMAKEDKKAAKAWKAHMDRSKLEMFPSMVTHEVQKAATAAAEAAAADYGYLKRRVMHPMSRPHHQTHTRSRRTFKHLEGGKRKTHNKTRKMHKKTRKVHRKH